jgi:hypothetical protein
MLQNPYVRDALSKGYIIQRDTKPRGYKLSDGSSRDTLFEETTSCNLKVGEDCGEELRLETQIDMLIHLALLTCKGLI